MSLLDGLHPVTTEGQILLHIANTLDELNAKLPDPAPVEPEPAADDAPTTGESATVSKKPPVKKATARKRVTGQ